MFFYTVYKSREVKKIVTLYLDVIFLTAFLLDFTVLFFFGKLFSFEVKGIRLLLGAFIGGIFEILPWVLPFTIPMLLRIPIIYIGIPILQLLLTYLLKRWQDFVKGILFYYGIVFLMGGLLEWLMRKLPGVFQSKYNLLLLCGAIIFLLLFFMKCKEILYEQLKISDTYLAVQLLIGDKKISCMGLMDTGNQLFDPISKKPVIIIERRLLAENEIKPELNRYRLIPYKSVGKQDGLLEGFVAEKLLIEEKKHIRVIEKVVVGIYDGELSKDRAYEVILNPML